MFKLRQTEEELCHMDFHCPCCGRAGKGSSMLRPIDDLVRCPDCWEPALSLPKAEVRVEDYDKVVDNLLVDLRKQLMKAEAFETNMETETVHLAVGGCAKLTGWKMLTIRFFESPRVEEPNASDQPHLIPSSGPR